MYIIKNALKNIVRNKGRNLLLGTITTAILLIILLSTVMNKATEGMINHYKEQYGSKVNMENTLSKEEREKQPPLSTQFLLSIQTSAYLQKAQYKAQIAVSGQGLSFLDEKPSVGNEIQAKAFLKATTHFLEEEDFRKGMRVIKEGRMPLANQKECIISEDLAKLNALTIGDTLTVISIIEGNPLPLTLTISGIYEDKMLQSNATSGPLYNRFNELYTDFETLNNSELFQLYGKIEATFFLKNPKMLKDFEKELREKGLPNYYKITTEEQQYQNVIAPFERIRNISSVTMKGVLIGGLVLLFLISLLTIRERKYEIGVLRAIGIKKRNVALSMILENIGLVLICFAVAFSITVVAQKPVAQTMIKRQSIEQEEYDTILNHSTMTGQDAIEIIVLSLSFVLISSLTSIFIVTRLEPAKLLSSSNRT